MLAAIESDPLSSFVWEQSGRLNQLNGDLQRARADFSSAVQLNPANSDALAAYARLLALSGQLAAAEAMANEAIRGSPVPPPWYMGVPALVALQEGQFGEAVASAELYATSDRELGPILAIMAGQQLSDSEVVNRYLPEVLKAPNFRAEGVMPRLHRRISDEDLLSAVEGALIQAGVPPAALSGPF
jgi:tetratricopeptide (TPR) repeat protein